MNLNPESGIVVGVDGGGTKTDVVALDLQGHVVAHTAGKGTNPRVIGVTAAARVLDSLLRSLLRDTATGAGAPPVVQVNLYISGLNLASEIDALRDVFIGQHHGQRNRLDIDRLVIDNDLFALMRTGTNERNAIAVACGTGLNCLGLRHDGVTARFAALGRVSGDWGGGWLIGETALWFASRSADGRGEKTELATTIPQLLGLANMAAVIEGVHHGTLDWNTYPQLVPAVFLAADNEDVVAEQIIDRQADEIVKMTVSALTRLGLNGQRIPVILGGGVLSAGNARLLSRIEQRLRAQAPLAEAQLVVMPPVIGAGLLALEYMRATDETLRSARENMEDVFGM